MVGNWPKKDEINCQLAAFCSITVSREFPGMGKDFPGMPCRRFPGNFPPGKKREASLSASKNKTKMDLVHDRESKLVLGLY